MLIHQPYSITPLTLSAFFYISPTNKASIVRVGELRSKSKFLGDSVSTTMEGENCIPLMGTPEHSKYLVTMPNMNACGTLCGKMVIELAMPERHYPLTSSLRPRVSSPGLAMRSPGEFGTAGRSLARKTAAPSRQVGRPGGRTGAIREPQTLARARHAKDMDAATAAKGPVENAQRELLASSAKHATRSSSSAITARHLISHCVLLPPTQPSTHCTLKKP
ncbi:hypothetical protein EI94DRAFT_1707174 [Lactarius quietus]|nr:hypothetical protein EI94DRAFT_1707174 [Lactarius quietus]